MTWGTQPWLKTNWPFSMASFSCRCGDGVPAYLPPLFFRRKQAMTTTRVSSATAHMVPIIQPWVEKLLSWLAAPENKLKRELKNQLYTPGLLGGPNASSTLKQLDLWLKKNVMSSGLMSHWLFTQMLDRKKTKANVQGFIGKKMNKFTRSAQSVTHSIGLIMICWCCYH